MLKKKKEKFISADRENGLFRIYRTFVCYVILIAALQRITQAAVFYLAKGLPPEIGGILVNAADLIVFLTLILILGRRYYGYLGRISDAITALSHGEKVHIPEEGATEALARSINQTSEMLEEQQKMIAQRDTARMEWIRGVSHDIRTPLSMVMGYSELLEEERLTPEQLHCVEIIKEQSVKMKALIEDLNLTSKLEHGSHPLRLAALSPAELLRASVAGAINSGCIAPEAQDGDASENYQIELMILPEFETLRIQADGNLLRRVFDNLIGNAVRHNPDGCSIMILAYCSGESGIIEIRDNGTGIPDRVARILNAVGSEFTAADDPDPADETEASERPHIMGMRIAKQIMLAHGGNLFVKPDRHTVEVVFPCEKNKK